MLAFACEPDEGSEPEVGWQWAQVMARSCDVTVITQTKNRERIERWCREHNGNNPGVEFIYVELSGIWRWIKKRVPGGMYAYYTCWQWMLKSEVARLLESDEFDLIHHVTFASFRMPVFVSGRPLVWGPVGGAETAPMQLLDGFGTLAGKLRERVRNVATHAAARLLRLMDPTRRCGGIALASTPATAEVLKRGGISAALMPAIGYEFDEDVTGVREVSAGGPLRLLFVGRLHLLKGLHLLLQALAQLKPADACLTIVGSGPEQTRLTRLAEKLGIASRCCFSGFVPRNELAAIFARHDVVVAPSLYESGGLSVLEGFAHGLPAIVLDCGGHALSVAQGCGIRIRPDQAQDAVVLQLRDAILRYSGDRDLVRQHGMAARVGLRQRYGWNSKHDAMLETYQRLLDKDGTDR